MSDTIEDLIHQAQNHPDWEVRRRAARYLGRTQSADSERVLTRVVDKDTDQDVVEAAILSLRSLNAVDSIETIAKPKVVFSENSNIRWAAAYTLGAIGSIAHFDLLAKLAEDSDWCVRNEAVTTLEKLADALKAKEFARQENMDAIKTLIRMLKIKHKDLQNKIVSALSGIADPFTENILLESLQTTIPHVIHGLVRVLGITGTSSAIPGLIKVLKSPHWECRQAACIALGRIGGNAAVNAVIDMLTENNEKILKSAVQALSRIGDNPDVLEIIVCRLHHTHSNSIRRNLLVVLGQIQNESTIPDIIRYLGSIFFLVRTAAINALMVFGSIVIPFLIERLKVRSSRINDLIKQAESGNAEDIRVDAIKAIGNLRHPLALNFTLQLTQNENSRISHAAEEAWLRITEGIWLRSNCANILGNIGDAKAIGILIEAMDDQSGRVCRRVIGALGKLRDKRAVKPLCSMAADEHPETRRSVVEALVEIGCITPEVRSIFMSALEDPAQAVRAEAARGLAKAADNESMDALVAHMNDPVFRVRRNIRNALYSMGDEILPKVREQFRTTDRAEILEECLLLFGLREDAESRLLIIEKRESIFDQDFKKRARMILRILDGKDHKEHLLQEF